MNYAIRHIAAVIGGEALIRTECGIDHLLTDSRRIIVPERSLFFALEGPRRNGSTFIPELYRNGVRSFVVSELPETEAYPEANFIVVKDTLKALQQLAAWHRGQFSNGTENPLTVIGITGSNGKTIVKEWLYQLLHTGHSVVRSPRSYNSQIGVPLSVWQIHPQHDLALFEAGISQPGEMERLEPIIRPDIGILTMVGEAHSEHFSGRDAIFSEKMKLYGHSRMVIACGDDQLVSGAVKNNTYPFFTWGFQPHCQVRIGSVQREEDGTSVTLELPEKEGTVYSGSFTYNIPFTDDASVSNSVTCAVTCWLLGMDPAALRAGLAALHPVSMRLELKKGINHCTVINDSYSADLHSLEIALGFLDQQAGRLNKTVILSDLLQSGLSDEMLFRQISSALEKHGVNRLIGIGPAFELQQDRIRQLLPGLQTEIYGSTEIFCRRFRSSAFRDETILIKGARIFEFERIAALLEQQAHQTLLEIDLNALKHNLHAYQSLLGPDTKIMAMVKAFAYGSGGAEIAGVLQSKQVDYLAVAYADEGAALREAGIRLPVMVMNPEESAFDMIVQHRLEPDLYSFGTLEAFSAYLEKEGIRDYPVHAEIETGMNRLGFATSETAQLAIALQRGGTLKLQSLFTHLAASEEAGQDDFTIQQFRAYTAAADDLQRSLGYPFIRHIANTAAAVRHPSLKLDMVRLGIGLYGVDTGASGQLNLQSVATLRTTIAQIKELKAGASVGYNRRAIMGRTSRIATVRIGYADGYPRSLGNGKGYMLVNGRPAPVTGSVCMDMTMIDITDIPDVTEGEEVIVFGKDLPVQQLAEWAGTIPYEIMTGVSQRVKRVYFEE